MQTNKDKYFPCQHFHLRSVLMANWQSLLYFIVVIQSSSRHYAKVILFKVTTSSGRGLVCNSRCMTATRDHLTIYDGS